MFFKTRKCSHNPENVPTSKQMFPWSGKQSGKCSNALANVHMVWQCSHDLENGPPVWQLFPWSGIWKYLPAETWGAWGADVHPNCRHAGWTEEKTFRSIYISHSRQEMEEKNAQNNLPAFFLSNKVTAIKYQAQESRGILDKSWSKEAMMSGR